MLSPSVLQHLIQLFGWLYFIIWSISFYPQVFLLYKQKSAMGMSSNYIFINLTGYVMYTVYNLYGYAKGDNAQTGVVDNSDLLFSMHSVFVYSVTVGLFFYYPHKLEVSMWAKVYLAIQWVVFIYFGVQFLISEKTVKLNFFGVKTGLGYFQILGYFKMFSTLLKHPPQIYHNFKRKSTKGWSIQGMIMDFLGGLFSLIALLLRLYINPQTHVNIAKLFLSVISMFYDATYMVQHYVLYGDKQAITPGQKQRQSPKAASNSARPRNQQEEKFLKKKQVKSHK